MKSLSTLQTLQRCPENHIFIEAVKDLIALDDLCNLYIWNLCMKWIKLKRSSSNSIFEIYSRYYSTEY